MFSKQKYINILSIVLILFVNSIFFYKYSVLYTGFPGLLTLGYIMTFTGIIVFSGKMKNETLVFTKSVILWTATLFSVLVLVYILSVPRMGEIGRLPAIEDWLTRFRQGEFPYNSPHTPSSYPFIFWIAYPFYLTGNTGILEFLGIALFMLILFSLNDTSRGRTIKLLMLAGSTVVIYEIVTRSELLLNVTLAAGTVVLCEKYLDTQKIDLRFFALAALTGLILGTRSVTALLFFIYFLYSFRPQFHNLIFFTFTALMVFALLIIPFYSWDSYSFMRNGPFAVQSYLSNLPFFLILLIFIAAAFSGWIISDLQEFFFSSGLLLFIAALISFIIRSFSTGIYNAIINDGYDISYFIFCIPLLILSVKDYSTDYYLGKIYK